MPTIPYVKQTWTDGVSSYTGARGAVQEDGIFAAHYQPYVQVSHNTTNSVLNNTATALACNTESFDQASNAADTMHDTSTNNSRLTIRYAGIYLVWVSDLIWSANPTNAKVQFRDTGSAFFGTQQVVADWRTMATSGLWSFSVNDYVECLVTQISGGTLTIGASFNFAMVRVG
jgi:hypothetical protein